MSAALARRDDGCASDLLMDRWLLGEIPGSDEARRLETHVKGCAPCQSRLLALRSLYGNQPSPKPAGRPLAPRLVTPLSSAPGQSGAMQVVILRDGLLVGTEVFTPGRYVVGSAATSPLKLEGLEGHHARLHLQGDRIAIEAAAGELFVNGYRVTCCELRPIDEVAVGPYVLRTRLLEISRPELSRPVTVSLSNRQAPVEVSAARIPGVRHAGAPHQHGPFDSGFASAQGERFTEAHGLASGQGERLTDASGVASVQVERRVALQLELSWGDAKQQIAVFTEPEDLAAFGAITFAATDGGFDLELLTGETLVVRAGHPARANVGPLTLIAQVVPREDPIARKPVREWPWLFLSLAATLLVGLITFGIFAPVPDDEKPFEVKDIRQISILVPMPKAKPKVKQDDVKPEVVHLTPGGPPRIARTHHGPPAHTPTLPHFDVSQVLTDLAHVQVKTGGARHTASIGSQLPGSSSAGSNLGFGLDDGSVRIGGAGLRNVTGLATDGIGHRTVHGGVEHPTHSLVHASTPGYDRDAIAKVINANLAQISHCYESAMMSGGAFSGKMLVEWAITTSGTVAASRVKDTDIKNASFGSCVLRAMNQWHFPPAKGRVVVSYPFHVAAVGY